MFPKRVFIHDSVNDPLIQRGVDHCFVNYCSALASEFPDELIFYSKRKKFPRIGKQIYPINYLLREPFPRRISNNLDRKICQNIANQRSDLYYSPYYGRMVTKIPQVFSAYDMIFEKYENYFSYPGAKVFVDEKKCCFERASLIICISQNTANDILEFYPHINGDKVKVVHIGIEDSFHEKIANNYIGKPYFLFVGNRSLYKNFERLLIAFGQSNLSSEFDLRIISPINDFPTQKEKEYITQFRLQNSIKFEFSVSECVLRKRYQQAFAYVFPSEYEGFGLPLIEAMASGTLVLSSNSSSLPEIGENIPLYFDPLSIESIKFVLEKSITLPGSERQERINNGVLHSRKFSWSSSKKKFIDHIHSII